MAPHGVDLGDYRYIEVGAGIRRRYRGAQTRATSSDDKDIMLEAVGRRSPPGWTLSSDGLSSAFR
jgi:hypothetical protein